MKKTIIFTLASLCMALTAYATYSPTWSTTLPSGLTGKLSTNVVVGYSAGNGNLGYVVGTYHTSGTKEYASSSGDAAIWSNDTTKKDLPDAPTGTASADFKTSDGWSAI